MPLKVSSDAPFFGLTLPRYVEVVVFVMSSGVAFRSFAEGDGAKRPAKSSEPGYAKLVCVWWWHEYLLDGILVG